MPELATTQGYGIQGVKYDPRAFSYGPAPEITVDNSGAIGILGNAQALGIVSDTLSKLPTVIQEAYKKGQLRTEQNIAHQLKMGALSGGLNDTMKIGADDSVTLNPEDPETAELKRQAIIANTAYRNAMAKKANAPQTVNGPFDEADLPGTDAAPAPSASPALSRPTGNTDALGQPVAVLPPGSAKSGPLSAPTDFNQTPDMPDRTTGALSQAFTNGASETIGAQPAATTQGALSALPQQETPALVPPIDDIASPDQDPKGLTWKKGNRSTPAEGYDKDGNLAAVWVYGAKQPHFLPRPAAPKPTEDQQVSKAARVRENNELIARGHTAADIAAMTDEERRAEIAKPKPAPASKVPAMLYNTAVKYGLDVDLGGKDANQAAAAIKEAMGKKGYELAPEQLKQYNTMVAQMARNPILKTAGTANVGYEAVMSGFRQKNGIGDISMVDGLMRLVNPSMGVTAHAADSVQQGIPTIQRVTGLAIDKIFNGDQLTDTAREQIVKSAKDLREAENKKRKGAIDAYLHQAQMDGLTPAQVDRAEKDALAMFAMEDPDAPVAAPPTAADKVWPATTAEEYALVPPGALFMDSSGTPKRKKKP